MTTQMLYADLSNCPPASGDESHIYIPVNSQIPPAPLMKSVTRIELGEILLAEAQKAVPAHTSYPGHVTVYAQEDLSGLCPNWTIQGFTPWTANAEECRVSLGAAERELKNSYRVG